MMNNQFFTRGSADGSDMRPVRGMYINPINSNEWSNMPYDDAQKAEEREFNSFYDILNKIDGDFTTEYIKIQNKVSLLNRREREFVIKTVESGRDADFDQRNLGEVISDAINYLK